MTDARVIELIHQNCEPIKTWTYDDSVAIYGVLICLVFIACMAVADMRQKWV